MDSNSLIKLNPFITFLKEFIKEKDLTFNGIIDNAYLESYKSSLICKSDLVLRYCFTLLENIIINETHIYTEKYLLNKKTIEKIIEIIEFSIKNQVSFILFRELLFSISKTIECIYKVSELITQIFKFENVNSYDYFCMLLFNKNFDKGLEILRGFDAVCDLPSYEENYTFENFIEDIKNGYKYAPKVNESCYVSVFKSENRNLIPKLINNIKIRKEKYELNYLILLKFAEKENYNNTISNNNISNQTKTSDLINDEFNEKKEKDKLKRKANLPEEKKDIEKGNGQKNFEENKNNIDLQDKLDNNLKKIIIYGEENKEEHTPKTMYDYLKEKYEYYSNKNIPIPILSYILKNNVKIEKEYFQFFQINDQKGELYYDMLEKIIKYFQLNRDYPDKSKYGYFVYKDINSDYYIESIYSTVDPEIIFEYTDRDENYQEDNYKKKAQLAFKCRALSFEYYINKLFIKKYKATEYPRVIFPFRKVERINEVNEIIFSDKNKNEVMEEIDGCYINNYKFEMIGIDIPFKVQSLGKIFSFYFPELKMTKDEFGLYEGIIFDEGDLSILEIKNSFPPDIYVKDDPKDFKNIVNVMLKRMLIYVQLQNEFKVSFRRIRLILFYDVVKCGGYQKDLEEVFINFYKKNNVDYKQKICFQLIYIDSNYYAKSLKTMEDRMDHLEKKVMQLTEEISDLKRKLFKNLKFFC